MEIKSNKISNFIFYVYFLLVLLSSTVSSFSNIYSKYSLIVQSILLIFIFLLNVKEVLKDVKSFYILVIILLFSILSILVSNGGMGSFLNIFHFLGGILIFNNLKINKKMKNYIYYICIILWFFNIRLSFNAWSSHISGDSIYNPNGIAIFIFLTTIIIKSYLDRYSSKIIKVITILLYTISAYCIYLTNCRTALIALIFYLLMYYIPIVNKIIIKYRKVLLYILVIIGILFPIIYVNMYVNKVSFDIPFMEKGLYTGRENLWYSMLESLGNENYGYMFGLGTSYYTHSGIINNFHNWYIGVLYTFGIPLFLLYYYYLINIFSKIKTKEILYGLIAIFIIGFTETLGLWVGSQVYIFMFLIAQKHLYREGEINDNNIYTNI